jgi:hypothetical protein
LSQPEKTVVWQEEQTGDDVRGDGFLWADFLIFKYGLIGGYATNNLTMMGFRVLAEERTLEFTSINGSDAAA